MALEWMALEASVWKFLGVACSGAGGPLKIPEAPEAMRLENLERNANARDSNQRRCLSWLSRADRPQTPATLSVNVIDKGAWRLTSRELSVLMYFS